MPQSPLYSDQDVFESLGQRGWEVDDQNDGYDRSRLEGAGDPDLLYPKASQAIQMPTQGFYPGRWPAGAVVHFTAGRCDRGDADAEATVRYGASQKHCYFCISRTGRIYQTAELSRWGSHAGVSTYHGLGSSVSSKLLGIEVCNAGRVEKTERGYEPWWNKPGDGKNTYYGEDAVRLAEKRDNILSPGYFQKYTPEQEESLIELMLWLRAERPDMFKFEFVLGHDEVSPRRKDDPGGSLSMTMPQFRNLLHQRAARTVVPVAAAPPVAQPAASRSAPPAPPVVAAATPSPPSAAAGSSSPSTPVAMAAARIPTVSPNPPSPSSSSPPHSAVFLDLLTAYRATPIDHPHLKDITFAQWAHETGYGKSPLAVQHNNFAGMKWRPQMAPYAKSVFYRPEHDPNDTAYCGFLSLTDFIKGYWHRLDIASLPYAAKDGGWRAHAGDANAFIEFIGPIWAPEGGDNSALNNGYVRKVKGVLEKLRQDGLLPSSQDAARGMQVAMAALPGAPTFESASTLAAAAPPSGTMPQILEEFFRHLQMAPLPPGVQPTTYIADFLKQTGGGGPGGPRGRIEALVSKIAAEAPNLPPNMIVISDAAEIIHVALADISERLPPDLVKSLVNSLKKARAFDVLAKLCDRLIVTGHDEPIVHRLYAQALVELGHIIAAIHILEDLKRRDLPEKDLKEVLGQLGRANKQLYVNHVRTAGGDPEDIKRFSRYLRKAIGWYQAGYEPGRALDTAWHGVNLVAMLRRARADGVAVEGGANPYEIAQQLVTAVEPGIDTSTDPWAPATLGEAYLALGQAGNAVKYFTRYARDTDHIGAFELGATIRQLEEVWSAEADSDGMRRSLMALKAAAAGKGHAEFGLNAEERKLIRSDKFESTFPDSDFIKYKLLKSIVRAGECVAWVKDRNGNGVGSGFLVQGYQLAKSLGDEVYLITNTHVICDPDWGETQQTPGNALRPGDARIYFEAAGDGEPQPYLVEKEAVWQSPSSEYDACVLRLVETPKASAHRRVDGAELSCGSRRLKEWRNTRCGAGPCRRP